MKVSLNWLREFVELPSSTDELVQLLTLAGVEVEGVHQTGCAIANVVVAQILSSEKHPAADKLSVTTVDDGSGTPRQIVCGAKNYKVGDKVPCALPGAALPGDFKIKAGKLRGVDSNGMLCSADELGLPPGEDGLLILGGDPQPGTPIGELFKGDTVIEIEITPNRPDLISHIGLAREVATLTGQPLRLPKSEILNSKSEIPAVSVQLTSPVCPCYIGCRIEGVKVGPSPDWLRAKLEAVGLRPINNLVDITNLVLFETGQPLHVFDAAKVSGGIVVRAAREGESLAALDGKTYALAPEHLVIADEQQPLAIAGVMGGEPSGVQSETTAVILEVAYFSPTHIRRTSRALGLSSDSSYRFERGTNAAAMQAVAERTVALILQLAGGTASPLTVAGQPPVFTATVPLRNERACALIGAEVSDARIAQILTGFGLTASAAGWVVPSFRPDLTREVDLIEEVARVVGMDAITGRVVARIAAASESDRAFDRQMELRRTLAGLGLHEARSLTLLAENVPALAFTQTAEASLVRVKNPMNADQVTLRPGLLPGLLAAVRHNANAGVKSIRLFEIGRVFSQQTPGEFPHLAFVLSGPVGDTSWREAQVREADLYDAKGIVTRLLGSAVQFVAEANPSLALSLTVKFQGRAIGCIGQLWPADARAHDATAAVVFAELDLSNLPTAPAAKRYKEIPRYPSVTRDVAMLAPLALAHTEIENALKKAKEPLLEGVELFDVFTDATGAKIPADKKSLAYSLTYRLPDRTLTADEVNAAHAKLKTRLTSLGVALRE